MHFVLWLVCRVHYCYSARLFKPLYLGKWEETLRSYKAQKVSVSNQVQNDCKAHENFSAIRLARYALVSTGVILTIMNFTGLEKFDLCLLICFHPSAYQRGTRELLPRDIVTGAWASLVMCIYLPEGSAMDDSQSQFPLYAFLHLHDRYTKRRAQSPHSNRILFPRWQHRNFTLNSSSNSCEHAARKEIFYSRIMHADLRIQIYMFIYHKHKPILLVHLVLFIIRRNFVTLISLKHLKLRVKCKYIAHGRGLYMRTQIHNYFTQNHFPVKCRGSRFKSCC